MSIDRLKQEYEIDIRLRGFPFHTDVPQEGMTLEQLFPGSPVKQITMQMQHKAAEYGLPMGEISHIYNSRLSQELLAWANSQGQGDAFHKAAFEAYFVNGQNIAEPPVLVEIADSAGLDRTGAARTIEERVYRNHVDSDWSRARELSITAIPTLILVEHRIVGAQPYDTLVKLMSEQGVAPKSEVD